MWTPEQQAEAIAILTEIAQYDPTIRSERRYDEWECLFCGKTRVYPSDLDDPNRHEPDCVMVRITRLMAG